MNYQELHDKPDAEERKERDLLEAAPDMLEALKTIKIMLDEKWKDMSNAKSLINNAIAKAEGR